MVSNVPLQEPLDSPKLPKIHPNKTSIFNATAAQHTDRAAANRLLELDRAKNARRVRAMKNEMLAPLKKYQVATSSTDLSFLCDDVGHGKSTEPEGAYDFLLPASLIPTFRADTLDDLDGGAEEVEGVGTGTIGDMGHPQKWMQRIFPTTKPSGRTDAVALDHWLSHMIEKLKEEYSRAMAEQAKSAEAELEAAAKGSFHREVAPKLEYMKSTQRLFSVCMHEVIRQTSVHCVERGQVLAKVCPGPKAGPYPVSSLSTANKLSAAGILLRWMFNIRGEGYLRVKSSSFRKVAKFFPGEICGLWQCSVCVRRCMPWDL